MYDGEALHWLSSLQSICQNAARRVLPIYAIPNLATCRLPCRQSMRAWNVPWLTPGGSAPAC